jgi:branched-subunit amino acid transport protein AzlD
MRQLKAFIRSPHIHIALATAVCIIIMAYFSKRIFSEPLGYLASAIPPFFMVMYELLIAQHKDHKLMKSRYWIGAILASTAVVILYNFVKAKKNQTCSRSGLKANF